MTAQTTLFDWRAERDAALQQEEWRDVPGYIGQYAVSNEGRVKSLARKVPYADGHLQPVPERIMRPALDTKGYWRINLSQGGKVACWAIHRMVMLAFSPRGDWKQMHVNHKDGVRTNNHLENLEWCTNAENRLHSYRVLKRPNPMLGRRRELHPGHTPVTGRCRATGEIREYPSVSAVVDDGFKRGDVSACASGRQCTHKEWEWKYGGASAWKDIPPVQRGIGGARRKYPVPTLAVGESFEVEAIDSARCIAKHHSNITGKKFLTTRFPQGGGRITRIQ